MKNKWTECMKLRRKLKKIESNLTRPADKFAFCFGCLYNFSVITDDQTTANMDP